MGVHMSAKSMALKLLHAGAMALVVSASGNVQAAPLAISDIPLFLNPAVPPLNMIIMGRDHKLYYEAYNDASDLNNDGVLDTRYKGYELKVPAPDPDLGISPYKIDYYGYFDSFKCYAYDSSGFWDPVAMVGAGKTCTGDDWSGDFLNYLTTSRIDALRKVMYGGDRSLDTAADTILERSYIPQDAHSWGKDYAGTADGYNIADYTSLSVPTSGNRHFFANTTLRGTGPADSTLYSNAPLLRIAENVQGGRRIWNWVSKERPVADSSGTFMDPGTTTAPLPTTIDDRQVRVRVCKASGLPTIKLEPNCIRYPDGNYKPTGIIQEYGEGASPRMFFGLMTGSYAKNTSGGVLRRGMGSMPAGLSPGRPLSEEIDPNNGRFLTGTLGIIATARIAAGSPRARSTKASARCGATPSPKSCSRACVTSPAPAPRSLARPSARVKKDSCLVAACPRRVGTTPMAATVPLARSLSRRSSRTSIRPTTRIRSRARYSAVLQTTTCQDSTWPRWARQYGTTSLAAPAPCSSVSRAALSTALRPRKT
jgi:type IV pilus assembly protein PilY1